MFGSGLVELLFGVAAEGKGLEEIAPPLSATDGSASGPASLKRRVPLTRWAPRPQASRYPRADPYRSIEVDEIVRTLASEDWPFVYGEIGRRVGATYWGPRCLRGAVRSAVFSGRIRALGGDRYAASPNTRSDERGAVG